MLAQRMFYVPFRIDKSPTDGLGVFAVCDIRRGQKIFVMNGPYITRDESIARGLLDYAMPVSPYLYHVGPENFINHSCRPNLGFVDEITAVALVDITPGTEFTWDYSVLTVDDWTMVCNCQLPICRKDIGNYRDLPLHLQEEYRPITPSWVSAFKP